MNDEKLQPGDRVVIDVICRDRGRTGVVKGLAWMNDGTLIVLLDPVDDTPEELRRKCFQPWELHREGTHRI